MTLKVRSYEIISLKLVNQRNSKKFQLRDDNDDPIWTYATVALQLKNYELKNRILWCFYPKRQRQAVFNATTINADNNRTGQQHITMICLNTNKTVNIYNGITFNKSFSKSPVQNEYIFTHMHLTHLVIISRFNSCIGFRQFFALRASGQ